MVARNTLHGGSGDDVLTAEIDGPGQNQLFGGSGADVLTAIGGSGNLLDGGAGTDRLVASAGDEVLLGGTGADDFVLEPALDQGTKTLGDFNGRADRLIFVGLEDLNVPGLADDLDAITDVEDAGAGLDVTVTFDSGTVLVFEGRGTGAVDSIADLVVDPASQLVAEPDLLA